MVQTYISDALPRNAHGEDVILPTDRQSAVGIRKKPPDLGRNLCPLRISAAMGGDTASNHTIPGKLPQTARDFLLAVLKVTPK
jgi:hypothetical protein